MSTPQRRPSTPPSPVTTGSKHCAVPWTPRSGTRWPEWKTERMKREIDYTWRLAELMAARGMHNSTDLIPLLVERGIELSRPQVYRVVHQRPKRVSLQMIAALCDILGCGVEDLVTVTAADVRRRKASASSQSVPKPNVVELNKAVRPRRAKVISDDD